MHVGTCTHPHQQIAPPAVANVPLLVGLIYLMQHCARARPLRSNRSSGSGGGETPPPMALESPFCASLAALWPPSSPSLKGSRHFLRGAPAITGLGGASHPGRMKTPFSLSLPFSFFSLLALIASGEHFRNSGPAAHLTLHCRITAAASRSV